MSLRALECWCRFNRAPDGRVWCRFSRRRTSTCALQYMLKSKWVFYKCGSLLTGQLGPLF